MNRRNLLIRAGALAATVGVAWWARETLLWPAPKLAFADGKGTAWMPHARRANVPTVRVRIAGRDLVALIDTGAQYSVIDRRLVAALPETQRSLFEMPLVAYGVGGGTQMGRGTTLALELPGLAITGLRAAILDLGPLATAEGLNAPLIIGRDVLEQAILAIDPQRRHSRLIAREAFVLPPDLAETIVRKSAGALIAEVSVEGSVIQAVVDTGASSLLALDTVSAQGAGLLDGRPTETGSSLVLGGAMQARVIEARTVTFADHLYERVKVGVFDQPTLPNFPGALIGMAAFVERRVAMDLGRGRLFVSRPLDLTVGPITAL
ncbi:MAG: peptidase aspartic [Brevundimonas sp.]|nr:MAG: peptidase aspartic [Brevundimonas sp.]